ncbi:MAG: nuclear transport factor 2 family protein [Bacteroidota bacterium]
MRIFLPAILVLFTLVTSAQQTEKADVKAVVLKLFTAMQQGDTAAARSCFDPSGRLQTALVNASTGQTKLENETIDAFIKIVSSIAKSGQHIEERVVHWDIKVDMPLAGVWAEYEFYVNDMFSHKGVDAFQLFKTNDGWKIIQLCDTRKK